MFCILFIFQTRSRSKSIRNVKNLERTYKPINNKIKNSLAATLNRKFTGNYNLVLKMYSKPQNKPRKASNYAAFRGFPVYSNSIW